jgi:hypothetical protein
LYELKGLLVNIVSVRDWKKITYRGLAENCQVTPSLYV